MEGLGRLSYRRVGMAFKRQRRLSGKFQACGGRAAAVMIGGGPSSTGADKDAGGDETTRMRSTQAKSDL